jgi:excisionase family DNA binding protein
VLRHHRGIAPYRDGERTERGELTLEETANLLKVSEATVRRLITERVLPARQLCKGAPWVIRADDLRLETVRQAANDRRARRPSSQDSRQNSIAL